MAQHGHIKISVESNLIPVQIDDIPDDEFIVVENGPDKAVFLNKRTGRGIEINRHLPDIKEGETVILNYK